MVKGYEFAKDQYVMFSGEEIKALEEANSAAIDIIQFVPLKSVDPVYFAGTYYLAPDKGGAKPYTLLATALQKAGQCGLGRWVSRGKEHIVIVRPMEEGLAMHQLHFPAEIRQFKDLGVAPAKVSDAEMKLAEQLIDHLKTTRFDPNEFVDEYKQRVEAAIQEKVEGHQVSISAAPTAHAAPGNVIDLRAVLRASLKRNRSPDAGERGPPKRVAPANTSTRKSARRRNS